MQQSKLTFKFAHDAASTPTGKQENDAFFSSLNT